MSTAESGLMLPSSILRVNVNLRIEELKQTVPIAHRSITITKETEASVGFQDSAGTYHHKRMWVRLLYSSKC